jgi:hypothetical protein
VPLRLLLAGTLLLAMAPATAPLVAAPLGQEASVAAVQANCLWKFSKYVTWPEHRFVDEEAPIVIGILGEDPYGKVLDDSVRGKTVDGRPIEIRRLGRYRPDDEAGDDPPDAEPVAVRLRRCHVVHIGRSEASRVDEILDLMERWPVLTVSDVRSIARRGGMIEFVLKEGKVAFHINRGAAERADVQISAKLLSLATIVESAPR